MDSDRYPRYFDIDGVIVKLELNGEVVSGFVLLTGTPYPPAKAIVDGHEITADYKESLL